MKVEEVAPGIFKINANSNTYVLRDQGIVIDCGLRDHHAFIKASVKNIVDPLTIKTVLLTHCHYDHIGCFDLFPNATFYASQEEIRCLHENLNGTVLDPFVAKAFVNDVEVKPISEYTNDAFETIECPGHSSGSIAFFYNKKILFSGDTIFGGGVYGRIDLPTSVPELMDESIQKLESINYEILCAGHDY